MNSRLQSPVSLCYKIRAMKIHRIAVLLAALVFAAIPLYAQQTGPVLADSESPGRG